MWERERERDYKKYEKGGNTKRNRNRKEKNMKRCVGRSLQTITPRLIGTNPSEFANVVLFAVM